MKTLIVTDNIEEAAEMIKAGGLVGVPTETVYGLSANGLDSDAVERIYEVKGRPETKPINLLVSGLSQAREFCDGISADAEIMAETFWPGPLTMIFRKKPNVPMIVTAGGDTVGVRCPAHEKTLRLIKLCELPLATPSANPSGLPSPKSFESVMEYFDGKIECVIDGGECSVGVESTIIDMTREPPHILRPGGLPREDIEKAIGKKVL